MTQDEIFNLAISFNNDPIQKVHVGPKNQIIYVKQFTLDERDEFDKLIADAGGKPTRKVLFMLFARDENGNRLFNVSDLPSLGKLPSYIAEPVIDAALKMNKLTEKDIVDTEGE